MITLRTTILFIHHFIGQIEPTDTYRVTYHFYIYTTFTQINIALES